MVPVRSTSAATMVNQSTFGMQTEGTVPTMTLSIGTNQTLNLDIFQINAGVLVPTVVLLLL